MEARELIRNIEEMIKEAKCFGGTVVRVKIEELQDLVNLATYNDEYVTCPSCGGKHTAAKWRSGMGGCDICFGEGVIKK